VLSPVNGKPMIDYLVDRYRDAVCGFVLVVHPSIEPLVRQHIATVAPDVDVEYAQQPAPTGMLDAILLAGGLARKRKPDRVWITWCDQIAVHPDTIRWLGRMSDEHSKAPLILPTALQSEPYIHLDRDSAGRIVAIRQRREGDAMPAVGESDMGLFSLSANAYFEALPRFGRETMQSQGTGERNFLPFIPWLIERGQLVLTFPSTNSMEAIGVNTLEDQRRIERYLRGLAQL
jgi:bifunctional N-acetylglucosamine-1-phosphate-uridyltransferase/glucosamine-1-phosphate-acetyltransferase GlmU-like protein